MLFSQSLFLKAIHRQKIEHSGFLCTIEGFMQTCLCVQFQGFFLVLVYRFITGLNANSLLDRLRTSGHIQEAFGIKNLRLTAEVLCELFHIRWSEEGSNRRTAEQEVIARWNDVLQDLEGTWITALENSITCIVDSHCWQLTEADAHTEHKWLWLAEEFATTIFICFGEGCQVLSLVALQ